MKYILQSNIDDCSKLLSVIKYLGLATPLLTKPLKSFIELGNLTKMRVGGADEAFRKKLGSAKDKRFEVPNLTTFKF